MTVALESMIATVLHIAATRSHVPGTPADPKADEATQDMLTGTLEIIKERLETIEPNSPDELYLKEVEAKLGEPLLDCLSKIALHTTHEPLAHRPFLPLIDSHLSRLSQLNEVIYNGANQLKSVRKGTGNESHAEASNNFHLSRYIDPVQLSVAAIQSVIGDPEYSFTGKGRKSDGVRVKVMRESSSTVITQLAGHNHGYYEGSLTRSPINDTVSQSEAAKLDMLLEHYTTFMATISTAKSVVDRMKRDEMINNGAYATFMTVVYNLEDTASSALISEITTIAAKALSHCSSFFAAGLYSTIGYGDKDTPDDMEVMTIGTFLEALCQTALPKNVFMQLPLQMIRGVRVVRSRDPHTESEDKGFNETENAVFRAASMLHGSQPNRLYSDVDEAQAAYSSMFVKLISMLTVTDEEDPNNLNSLFIRVANGDEQAIHGSDGASVVVSADTDRVEELAASIRARKEAEKTEKTDKRKMH